VPAGIDSPHEVVAIFLALLAYVNGFRHIRERTESR
jgi:hypothetical protein